jgi:glutathione S-transferase
VPLTFYYGSGSPFAWRVWLALEHKQVPYELKVMSFSSGDLRTPAFGAINPRHKVPAIVDEGFALYESVAIVEYLDERFLGAAPLFPGDVRGRALVRRMVQEADQYFGPALDAIADTVLFMPAEKWDAAAIAQAREKVASELQRWETLMRGDFLAGDQASAADFALYPLIALTLRGQKKKPDLDIAGAIGPRVTAWMQRVEAMACFQKTWPPHWR